MRRNKLDGLMKKSFCIILNVIFACLYGGIFVSCACESKREIEIVIISTNDLHGHFQHLPALSAVVNDARNNYKHVIVVDGGDRFTGNPYNDRYARPQYPITDLMNHIGYDVMVIGNTEFNHGVELLNQRIIQSTSAAIIANIDHEQSGLKNATPYHIIKTDGIKIAFLGLCNIESRTGKPAAIARHVENLVFYDPIETALQYKKLREKVNVFVALTHIGLQHDRTLADSMPKLDLIIGSHCHTTMTEPELRNGVTITQAGRYGRQIGKTIITLRKGVVTNITNELITLENWAKPVDATIIPRIREFQSNPFFFLPLVSLKHSIPNFMQLGYMMTDAAVAMVKEAEISIINFAGIRIDSLSSRTPVTLGDIIRLSPFDNRLYIVRVTPAELKTFLERRNCEMIPSGFIYETVKNPDGTLRVHRLMYPNGTQLNENKLYNLAIDNFLYSRYLSTIEAGRIIATEHLVVDVVLDYLRNNPDVDYRNRPPRVTNL